MLCAKVVPRDYFAIISTDGQDPYPYVHVCMYVRVYVCMYVCMYVLLFKDSPTR